jgi:hypothetical protein
MNKPEVKDPFPMHTHTCSGCGQSMRHYAKNGCSTPDIIECETCRNPPKEEKSGRGSRADAELVEE